MDTRTLAGEIRQLSRVTQPRGVAVLSSEVGLIAAAILLALWLPTLTPLAALIIATRQRALADLLHAGVHRHLARDAQTNDLLSELIAWPMGWSASLYRRQHCREHDQDAPPTLAITALLTDAPEGLSLAERMGMLSFYAAALMLTTSLGLWDLVGMLWLIPRGMMVFLPANVRWLDRSNLQAYSTQYRASHMRFPSVPWYHLERLNQRLEN